MPAIATERLLLRPFTLDDTPALFAMASDPDIIRYVGNTPVTSMEDALQHMQDGPLRDYEEHGYGRFACVWTTTGEVIGFSGVKFVPELNETELGYRFFKPYWGLGLATEAGWASIKFAREHLQLQRLVGVVHPDNSASTKVLQKLGFTPSGQTRLALIPDKALDLFTLTL